MDGIINFPLYFISCLIIIIAPGPDFIYVTTMGISEGNKAGVLSALGISTGLLIHTLFAAFGLSAIIQASRTAYVVIKYIGAGYLIYIGLKMLLKNNSINKEKFIIDARKKNIFRQGVLTNVFNPKAIVTFMAFLPQFIDIKIAQPIWQLTSLGIILSLIAIVWFGLVGYFAGTFGSFIRKSITIQNWIKYISGSIMVALGLRLAIKRD